MEERIATAIRQHLDQEGKLRCAAAFRVAKELDLPPLTVGQTANEMEIKLSHCQLGLFGYGPKAEGRHKIVRPADEVAPGLAQAIHDGLSEGKLSCRAIWEIAAALHIPKMEVSAAAEALEIKIVHCQLGAF